MHISKTYQTINGRNFLGTQPLSDSFVLYRYTALLAFLAYFAKNNNLYEKQFLHCLSVKQPINNFS